jgi:hypothetical protein
MIALETRDIGGGIVRRLFTAANHTFRAGDKLTAEQIKAWPAGNRRALIESRFIEVYPATPGSAAQSAPLAARKSARA